MKLLKQNQFLQALVVIGLGILLWKLRLVVLILFLAFLLTTILYPLVRWLKDKGLPTALAVLVPIVATIGLVGLVFYLLLPPFLARLGAFIGDLPDLLNSAARQLHLNTSTSDVRNLITDRAGGFGHLALYATSKALTLTASVITVLVLSIYWLGSYENVKEQLLALVPPGGRPRFTDIWGRIEIKMSYWIKAHMILNTVVGVLVLVALKLAHVPFADLLAFIAFLVEIIPTAGPVIAAAPAIALGLSQSLLKGVIVTIVYIIIQQIENHILSPLLLGRTVRLHPIVIIIGLLLGIEVYGIAGALIAVPVALCISAAVDSYQNKAIETEPGLVNRLRKWWQHRRR